MEIQFSDKSVDYGTFVQDIAAKLAEFMKEELFDPEYISQNKAYKMFGRGNIERWRKEGKVQPCKRPGKIEYPLSKLRELSRTIQDYL